MNKDRALEAIEKNARRANFKREDKSTCTNISLSSGTYQQVIMNLINTVNVNDTVKVNNESVTCKKNEARFDKSKNNVENHML